MILLSWPSLIPAIIYNRYHPSATFLISYCNHIPHPLTSRLFPIYKENDMENNTISHYPTKPLKPVMDQPTNLQNHNLRLIPQHPRIPIHTSSINHPSRISILPTPDPGPNHPQNTIHHHSRRIHQAREIEQIPEEPEQGAEPRQTGAGFPRRAESLPRTLGFIVEDALDAVCGVHVAEDVQRGADAPELGEEERAAGGVDGGEVEA